MGDALRELRGVERLEQLGPGVALVAIPKDFGRWAPQLIERRPVFVRHVCPVDAVVPVDAGLEALRAGVRGLLPRLDGDATFAGQVQLVDAHGPGRHQLRAAAHEVVTQELGLGVSIPDPKQVISIVAAGGRAYLGVSPTRHNLSSWPGGMRRYAREPGQVSRSEFKLLEALEAFEIGLRPGEHALDLGASPGGWTRVLVERGMSVVAVDQAELHPTIAVHPSVTHHRTHAQELASIAGLPAFSFVANDMRMDARDSARLMVSLKPRLADGGSAVMTLKLPKSRGVTVLHAARDILKHDYQVAGVRQLFHNRNEVTVHLAW
jgi:23S rRNA (cytidine2498-2'-O)-methyltransferase